MTTEAQLQEVSLESLSREDEINREIDLLKHYATISDLEDWNRRVLRINRLIDELEAMP